MEGKIDQMNKLKDGWIEDKIYFCYIINKFIVKMTKKILYDGKHVKIF